MATAKIAKNMLGFAQGVTRSVAPKYAGKAGITAAKTSAHIAGTKMGAGMLRNGMTSGVTRSIRNMDNGMKFGTAVKRAHMVNGKMSAGRVAGSIATVGIAGRVATGGGLYRDRYGNTNIPGVPFI